jgi:osmotically-inducible protein OsmY
MRSLARILAIAAAGSLASGCVTAVVAAGAGAGALVAQERTFGQGLDDSAATMELRTKLIRSDARGYANTDVKVIQGRALLAGSVPTAEHRVNAERIAWSSRGVAKVENQLDVGPRAGVWRSVRDEAITTQIRTQWLADAQVRAIDFGVETHKGVVYLMGVARDEAQVRRAAEIASYVRGVEKVVSYVEVRRAAPASTRLEDTEEAQRAPAPVVLAEQSPEDAPQ